LDVTSKELDLFDDRGEDMNATAGEACAVLGSPLGE
jgi:hypothetical protein